MKTLGTILLPMIPEAPKWSGYVNWNTYWVLLCTELKFYEILRAEKELSYHLFQYNYFTLNFYLFNGKYKEVNGSKSKYIQYV